jgi:hypothetical protein
MRQNAIKKLYSSYVFFDIAPAMAVCCVCGG